MNIFPPAPFKPARTKPSRSPARLLLGSTLLLLLFLPGCFKPSSSESKVLEPPYVPAPPVPTAVPKTSLTLAPEILRMYADLADTDDADPALEPVRNAVRHAISLGVINPVTGTERFEPDQPITYGEFRLWALAYQRIPTPSADKPTSSQSESANAVTPPGSMSAAPSMTAMTAMPAPIMNASGSLNPMDPAKLDGPPGMLKIQDRVVNSSHVLTRDVFCAVYVLLSHQEAKARALTPDAIDNMIPGPNKNAAQDSLQEFRDYPALAPWARPAVALAYHDGILQQIFHLSSSRLTVDEGFGPALPITRAQAIVFLDNFYGKSRRPASRLAAPIAPSAPSASGMSGRMQAPVALPVHPETGNARPSLNHLNQLMRPAQASMPMNNPAAMIASPPKASVPVVGHMARVEERTSLGSRSAMQINGPE